MSLRLRKDGRLLCGAATEPEPGDVYFDEATFSALSQKSIIVPDPEHETNSLWHWAVNTDSKRRLTRRNGGE